MRHILSIAKILLFVCLPFVGFGQIDIQTNFDPAIGAPIDVRFSIPTLADTSTIAFTYQGLITWVVDIAQEWQYTGSWNQKVTGLETEYFDVVLTGQSNAFNRDNIQGTWTYSTDINILAVQTGGTLEVANPVTANIVTGDTNSAPNEPRNLSVLAFAKQARSYDPDIKVRIAAYATGGRASYYWTPETTGPGELSASNSMLVNTQAKISDAPADFLAKAIIWQQGENDASEFIMNTYLNRIESIYDTLANHAKVADNFVMLLCYPDNSNTAYDSLRLSLDSVLYQTRTFGARNIIAVPYNLEGFDNIHFTNDQQEQIGKYAWAAYIKGQSYNIPSTGGGSSLWTDVSSVTISANPIAVATSATITNTTASSVYPISASKENDSEILRVSRNAVGGARFQGFDMIGGSSTNSSGGFWLDYLNNSSGSYAHRNMLRFHNTGVLFQGPSYVSAMGVFYEPDSVHIYGALRTGGNFRTGANATVDGNLLVTGTTTLGTVLSATFTSQSIVGTNSTPFNIERPATHRVRTLVGSSTNSAGGILYSYENWNGSTFVVDSYLRRYVGGFAFEKADGADVLTINTNDDLVTVNGAMAVTSGSGAHYVKIGDESLNSSNVGFGVARDVAELASGHDFSSSSVISNNLSFNAYDAAYKISSDITGIGAHAVAFQSIPLIDPGVTLTNHYGMYDRAQNSGTVTNYYGTLMQMPGGTINNYRGITVNGAGGSDPTSTAYGLNVLTLDAPDAKGIVIDDITGSTSTIGLHITGLSGSGIKPILVETPSGGTNEIKYTGGTGDVDLLKFSRAGINVGDEMRMIFEAGSTTKYYSGAYGSDYRPGLKGNLVFYTNPTGASGIGELTETARLEPDGVLNVKTGFKVDSTATSGNYLRGDGINFVSSAIQSSDITGLFGSGTDGRLSQWSAGVLTDAPILNTGTRIEFTQSTGVVPPSGTTAERSPTPAPGEWRYNETTSKGEVYLDGAWRNTSYQISATSTLDFPSTSANATSDLTIALTGAVIGEPVDLGVHNTAMAAGVIYFAWVSAADTVTVRLVNSGGGAADPALGSFTVAITK